MSCVRGTTRRVTRAVAAVGLGAALTFGGTAAWAESPMRLTSQITDRADALKDATAAQQAVADLRSKGLDLQVVFVDSFDGTPSRDWARDTYRKSGFGGNDVLLAVATEDRRYAVWTTTDSGLSPQQVRAVETGQIEPALRRAASDGDWGQAVVAAAQGFGGSGGSAGTGTSGSSGSLIPPGRQDTSTVTTDTSGGGSLLGVGAVAVGGVAVLGGAAALMRRKKKNGSTPQAGPQMPWNPGRSADGPQDDPAKRAAAALVALDDEIRSAGEELAFAEAQFGTQATLKFRQALDDAKVKSTEAFRLQHEIDGGAVPEQDKPARWNQIVALATQADQVLEQHKDEFAQMRDLQSRAPQLLSELERRVGEVRARIPSATQQLAALQASYPAEALRTVSANVTQAGALTDSAAKLIGSGRDHLEKGDRPAAVVSARGAEDALGHASSLLDAVDRAHLDLPKAASELDRRLASISSDVADAARLQANDPLTRDALAAATAAIEQGRAARTNGDPLNALAALDRAETDLDNALQSYRDAEENTRRTQSGLNERFDRVRARLMSIDDAIRTQRGAVGTEARTRISEALRLYNQATDLAATEPARALDLVTQAEQLGEDALRLAEADRDSWGGGWGGGWSGGPFGGYGGYGGRSGIDLGSLVLGGILMGGMGGHSHGGSWGGGGGGWGGDGGFGGGGSFGGDGGFGDGGSF